MKNILTWLLVLIGFNLSAQDLNVNGAINTTTAPLTGTFTIKHVNNWNVQFWLDNIGCFLNVGPLNTVDFQGQRISANGPFASIFSGLTITGTTPAAGKVWTATGGTGAGSWQTPAAGTGGTYTPALTNTANITASSVFQTATYIKAGNIVDVVARVSITCAANPGNTTLTISLPFTTTVWPQTVCGSIVSGIVGLRSPTGACTINGGNTLACTFFSATAGSADPYNIHFQYKTN